MSSVRVYPVTSKKQLMQFIKLPWKIYKNDPNWVPHLLMDRKKILSKVKNPFFAHAQAEYYLAELNGEIMGRIAAIKNDLHNQYQKDNAGFFGFFECINNQDAANALFDQAGRWLKDKGFSIMRGPASPSSNDEWGMLIKGFDDPPRLLMSYNPEYYNTLCQNYGFKKAKDLYAYKLENKKVLSSEKLIRGQDLVRKRSGLTLKEIDMKNFDSELEKVKYVYNKAWAPNWGFVPLTEKEIDAMAKDLKQLAEPKLVLFGEIKGELVGFALVLPDYNQIFINMNGRLFPFGFIKMLRDKKKITWSRIITLGIIPEYQKKGLDTVFYYEIVKRAAEVGIFLGEASWILEDNEMMLRGAELMNGERYKEYRIYDKEI